MNIKLLTPGGPYICDECNKLHDEIILVDIRNQYTQLCEKCAIELANNLTTLLKF